MRFIRVGEKSDRSWFVPLTTSSPAYRKTDDWTIYSLSENPFIIRQAQRGCYKLLLPRRQRQSQPHRASLNVTVNFTDVEDTLPVTDCFADLDTLTAAVEYSGA